MNVNYVERLGECSIADIPYIGFSNEQLENAPKIGKGDFATCPKCGTLVAIQDGNPPILQLISHCDKDWLVGIGGRYVQNIKPACSGELECDEIVDKNDINIVQDK